MNDLELKSLWQHQELTPPLQLPDAEILARMKKKMRKFDRTIFWRDVRELAACAFVLYAYHGMWVHSVTALGRAGCMVVMVSAVFIAAVMLYTRRKQKPLAGTPPVREYVQAELRKVGAQIRLLESVLWWYILPLSIGAEMYVLGETPDLAGKIVMTVTFIFVDAVIWWANRYAVRKTLLPLKTELENTLSSAPEFADADKTNP